MMTLTKDITTLEDDIYELLCAGREGRAPEIPEELRKDFEQRCGKAVLKSLKTKKGKREAKTLFASDLGHPCYRKLWYKVRPDMFVGEAINGAASLKFLYGDLIEEIILFLAQAAGHKVERRQELMEVPLKNGWRLRGRIDAIIDGVLVDVKSTSPQGFGKFKDIEKLMRDDPFGYIMQLLSYFSYIPDKNDKVAGFVAVDKSLGNMVVPLIKFSATMQPAMLDALVDIAEGAEPPRPSSADPIEATKKKDKLCTMCSYCEYKHHCWRDANGGKGPTVEIVSNAPRYIVKEKA